MISKIMNQLETVLNNDFEWSESSLDENDASSPASCLNEE